MAHYLKDTDIAERLGIHRVTVWRWSRAGVLPRPIRLAAGTSRWRAEDIEQWERERAREAVA